MRLPSASGMERALACPASVALPQVDTLTADAARGTVIHLFLQRCNELGRDKALELVRVENPEVFVACESIPLDRLPIRPEGFASEVAFAYDPVADTARELGRGIGRRYREHGLRPGEIPCTVDVVGLGESMVYVGEVKTGWREITPAARNWQVIVEALCASRAYGRDHALASILHTPGEGIVWKDEAEFDAIDLTLARDVLRKALPRWRHAHEIVAEGKVPNVTEGPHCHYCPAKKACPAVGRWLAEITDLEKLNPGTIAAALTPETARKTLLRIEQVESVLEMMRTALKAYARDNPIPVEEGKVWGPRTRMVRSLDGGRVYHAIAEAFGADVARRAVDWKSTQKLLEEVAKALPKTYGASIAKRKERLLDMLAEKGAVSETPREFFESYQPEG